MAEPQKRTIIIDGQEYEVSDQELDDYEHPLDHLFGINTLATVDDHPPAEPIVAPTYDDKDIDLDEELSKIAQMATDTFQEQKVLIGQVEPKFRGEMLNATTNVLNVALQAIKEKADLKKHKDKLHSRGQGKVTIGNSETTQIIVADRNSLLEQMKKEKKGE